MKFCPNCGAKLPRPGEDQFCMNCGEKLPKISEDFGQLTPAAQAFSPQQSPPINQGLPAFAPEAKSKEAPAEKPAEKREPFLAQKVRKEPDMFDTAAMKAEMPQRPVLAGPKLQQYKAPQPAEQKNMFAPQAPAKEEDLFAAQNPANQKATAPTAPRPAVQENFVAAVMAAAEADSPEIQQDLFYAKPLVETPENQPTAKTAEVHKPQAVRPPAQTVPRPYSAQANGQRPQPQSASFARPRPVKEPLQAHTQENLFRAEMPPPPKPVLPKPAKQIKKPSVMGRILTAFAVLIVFLVVCAGTILIMLYYQNRPAIVIDEFAGAISANDSAALGKLARVHGIAPTDAQWQAFCAAFKEEEELNALKSQLLMMAKDTQNANYTYPAVSIQGSPFILFIQRYKINIQAVSLLAQGASPGTALVLDQQNYAGEQRAEGELYLPLMPGRYQYRIVPQGIAAENVPPKDIVIFAYGVPNVVANDTPVVNITVSNCATDDAILYVNEVPVAEKPLGGVVVLQNVALGSTIRIAAIKDGVQMDASLVFNDLNVTELAFADYVTTGQPPPPESASLAQTNAAPTEAEINTIMAAFYKSYLECINQQSISGIQNTTDNANTSLASRITSTDNAGNLYQYTGVSCDAQSIKTTQSGDLPAVQFNAQFQFGHKAREGGADFAAASNYQSVELVFKDGKWLVNKMTFVSAGDFGAHTLAVFE